MKVNYVDHLLVQDKLTDIRRSGISGAEFRAGMIEIGRFISYEFANTLEKEKIEVKTPLGVSEGFKIKNKDDFVIVNVLRAAIPLVDGIMRVFTYSRYGVVGAWRDDEPPFNINLNYIRIPQIDGKIVIIADPMLATGHTMKTIINEIKKIGTPKRLVFFNVISSNDGLKTLSESYPELEVYTCAVDPEIDSNGYIVPGLGDAGDICFGKPSK